MTFISGPCVNPKPDTLYLVFGTKDGSYQAGVVMRGADVNWHSQDIIGYAETDLNINQAEFLAWKRGGTCPLLEKA